jgi:hypothetical protein
MDEELRGKLHFVMFEYTSEKEDEKAAMSFHLTTRDKDNIVRSMNQPNNVAGFNKLKSLLNIEANKQQ